ncbi:MAG: 50S ribosomal protein L5 [Candidatus Aenigmarchaeota archaeon]|nr:50S ribosomal protein L5 [Candidatus Aenigmarchaeota archaeon]
MKENPMREIRIEKVTLNIGCGSDADKLKRAEKLLQTITGQKPFITRTKKRTTFGMARKKPIGVKVTLRKEKAEKFLNDALTAIGRELKERQINDGNFSFGIKEYIDLPNVNYDPELGILGMDVCVMLERPGFRVKRRVKRSKIGKKHLITKEETIEWLKKFEVNIVG